MKKVFLLLTIFAIALIGGAQKADAQVLVDTFACNIPTCLDGTTGTNYYLRVLDTAVGVDSSGGAHNLEAFADIAVNGCSFPITGTVSGGLVPSPLGTGTIIGIIAASTASVSDLEVADFEEVCYANGTLGISGGGEYPC